ncbi:MAG: acyl-CoA dehydrogenase family protein [Burkholderiaceae bacterium]
MDHASASELQMLEDSARRWVRDAAGALDADERWAAMAGFGWLGISLPEACDGLGQGLAELCALARALGAGPVNDPLGPVVVQAAGLVALSGSDEQQQRWLSPVARGDARLVPAVHERGQAWRDTGWSTRATPSAGGWLLDGDKSLVAAGDRAQAYVVAAGLPTGESGFFIVPREAVGLTAKALPTVDAVGACDLHLKGVRVDAACHLSAATVADWHRVCDDALLVASAESSGAMDALLRTTADYLRTRVQFGKPLSANQALRHRMADLAVACEEARSMVQSGVQVLSDPGTPDLLRARKAAGVRAKVGLLARRVCEEAIQLHGGMGVTEELAVGVYLKRQVALDALLGPPEWHLRRHAQLRAAVAEHDADKPASATAARAASEV